MAVPLLGIVLYISVIYPAFFSPLAKLPAAHPLCHITRTRSRPNLYAAHKAHGPIVRIAPNEISVNSLEGLRSIYTAGLEKHQFYIGIFEHYNGTPNLVSMLNHKAHSVQKRMISSVYAKSFVQHSTDVSNLSRRIILERFLPLLRQYADDMAEVNVMDLWQRCGIDFMTAYIFGTSRSTDFLRDKEGREAYFGEWSQYRSEFVGEKKVVEGLCMRMLEDVISKEASGKEQDGTNPVLAPLLYWQLLEKAKTGDSFYSRDELMERCAAELLDHIVAAHETFAIALTYVVYRLSLDQSLQSALRSELSTINPPISPKSNCFQLPSPDQIDQLPILNGVLLETLRMHAPVPGRLPRIAPPSGMTLHGFFIPAGTTVSCNAYSLHRNEETFPRPFEWLPQRWMDEKGRSPLGAEFPPPEVIRRYMRAFGSGRRMCIGSNFAIQGMVSFERRL